MSWDTSSSSKTRKSSVFNSSSGAAMPSAACAILPSLRRRCRAEAPPCCHTSTHGTCVQKHGIQQPLRGGDCVFCTCAVMAAAASGEEVCMEGKGAISAVRPLWPPPLSFARDSGTALDLLLRDGAAHGGTACPLCVLTAPPGAGLTTLIHSAAANAVRAACWTQPRHAHSPRTTPPC